MAKAVLILDMPKSCGECHFARQSNILKGKLYCENPLFYDSDVTEYSACRPEGCPLKALPEKKDTQYSPARNPYITEGYNACLKEILGGGDDE